MVELPLYVGSSSSSSRPKSPPPCDHGMQAARTPAQKQKQQMDDSAARCSRTLAYKYGDMLYIVFGAPKRHCVSAGSIDKGKGKQVEPNNDSGVVGGGNGRGRRARKERRRRAAASAAASASADEDAFSGSGPAAEGMRFGTNEALAIESAILRYAESLQAATQRDVGEIRAQQRNEVQLAKQRRIPPYMYHRDVDKRGEAGGDANGHVQQLTTTLTNWQRQEVMPGNRSFQGFADNGRSTREASVAKQQQPLLLLPENVRTALSAVNAELVKHQENGDEVSVCVRMQDKGWVAAQQQRQEQTFCVVDQQNATLADAHSFLSRISKRARSLDASR
ncbi:hypothetical protein GGI23_002182 [Coemansia sp. RSA 2559]|nr:hypothetical protein GGI23_002182 [Coemansia sp. RSA 2559]